jgi:hypothetical protein
MKFPFAAVVLKNTNLVKFSNKARKIKSSEVLIQIHVTNIFM